MPTVEVKVASVESAAAKTVTVYVLVVVPSSAVTITLKPEANDVATVVPSASYVSNVAAVAGVIAASKVASDVPFGIATIVPAVSSTVPTVEVKVASVESAAATEPGACARIKERPNTTELTPRRMYLLLNVILCCLRVCICHPSLEKSCGRRLALWEEISFGHVRI